MVTRPLSATPACPAERPGGPRALPFLWAHRQASAGSVCKEEPWASGGTHRGLTHRLLREARGSWRCPCPGQRLWPPRRSPSRALLPWPRGAGPQAKMSRAPVHTPSPPASICKCPGHTPPSTRSRCSPSNRGLPLTLQAPCGQGPGRPAPSGSGLHAVQHWSLPTWSLSFSPVGVNGEGLEGVPAAACSAAEAPSRAASRGACGED